VPLLEDVVPELELELDPPMPLELDAVPELEPEVDECVVVPVVVPPLSELQAPRLAPMLRPRNAPAISQTFFMETLLKLEAGP
jgi:hypothetical protein